MKLYQMNPFLEDLIQKYGNPFHQMLRVTADDDKITPWKELNKSVF